MKLNKILILLFSFFLFSCNSIKEPAEVFVAPDFTEEDVRQSEIERISEMSKKEPVMAYWRSIILGDAETVKREEKNLFSLYEKALQEKNYFDAERYYVSLKNSGSELIDYSRRYELELFTKSIQDVPGLAEKSPKAPQTLSDCVNATVTIWVDKGIKIEHGYGYADRVLGSGFFIDKRGYIVTNHHVISDLVDPKYEGYSRLFIKLASDQETRIPAKVIGYDSVLDLALLKCDIEAPFIFDLGYSSGLNIGDRVNCIGTPLGLHGTVTSGIVSAVNRKLFTNGDVFQIDAAVNSGNSGGPCIDSKNRVQAIVFAGIMQYQGLNFAIPVEYLRQDLPFLYKGGKRNLAWLGGYGHTKKENGKDLGLEVQYVMPGGILSRAEVEVGDVLMFLNGARVSSLEEVQDVIRNFASNTILSAVINRNGENIQKLFCLAERPEEPGYEIYKSDLISSAFIPIFGMELTHSSTIMKKQYTVSRVIKGSSADESGFSEFDPVYISDVDFNKDNSAISVQLNTRKKKKGYLDITMRIGSALDSPYYF